MTPKLKAALLNAFVLPGLGQLLLGRKIKGFICIMLVNLILLAALFVVLKALSPVIAAQIAGGSAFTVDQLSEVLNASSGFGKGILFLFILVWGFALVDIFKGSDTKMQDE